MAPGPAQIAVQSGWRERQLDILRRGQRWDQVELLEDEADCPQPERGQFVVAEPCEVATLEVDLAVYGPARAYLERKQGEGKSRREALRCLKRQLARTVYTTLKSEPSLASPH
jgi:hypothetical protein